MLMEVEGELKKEEEFLGVVVSMCWASLCFAAKNYMSSSKENIIQFSEIAWILSSKLKAIAK